MKRTPVFFAENIKLLLDHAAHILRRCEIHLGDSEREVPALTGPDQVTALSEEMHETGNKEWVAFGPALDERSEVRRKIIWRKASIEVIDNVLFA